jgi:hypothetical protein
MMVRTGIRTENSTLSQSFWQIKSELLHFSELQKRLLRIDRLDAGIQKQKMKEYTFFINLSYYQWLGYYRGNYREIIVTSYEGDRLQIPAHHFTQFTTPAGLYGNFKLILTPGNSVASLVQL